MRAGRVAALVALCAGAGACGSSAKPAPATPRPVDARQQACDRYSAEIRPFLQRFEAAIDDYSRQLDAATDDAARAEAHRIMADFIATQLGGLQRIKSGDEELASAHGELALALEEVGNALEQLATAYSLGDIEMRKAAIPRSGDGWERWSNAVRIIVTRCPTK